MEPPERVTASPQLPADEDVSQSVGQTSINPLGGQSQSSENQDQRQPRVDTDGLELPQSGGRSLQLDFQDSNLSPALHLLPANSGVEHNFAEYTLFQQSDTEFAPLRAYPDVSMASERFHFPALDRTSHASECGSLSQHPLAQATILSEEGASSIYSLSQHSLSPRDQDKQGETVYTPVNAAGSRKKDQETRTNLPEKPVGEAAEDETFFLSKDVRAQHLLELLQKDVDMPSSSSSAVSSACQTSVKEEITDQRMVRREGPPGEASFPQQQTQQPDRPPNLNQSQAPLSQLSNITMGSRSTQPDDSSEALHRELLSEVERHSSHEAESKNKQQTPTPPAQPFLTPYPKEMSEGQPSAIRTHQGGAPWTLPFSAGVEQVHREQSLWSSGNQTGIDGSYLGFLPQSQSTPGVFKSPPKSSARPGLGQLSAIESKNENSRQSSTGVSSQSAVVRHTNTANQGQEDATSARVHSLPSVNYIQKVDAWRANQSSGKTSLFDSLALQGFSGVSPKKKAYDAVSDSLNRILSEQVRSLQQHVVSGAASHNVIQSSSTVPSGSSSPRRGEAVGSAPSERDNTGPAAPPSPSPFGRSQSHSSLSTVVMSVHKDQQTDGPPETEKSQSQDVAHHLPNTRVEPSPLMSLGRFSDVSLDRDLALSSSQDSYSEVKIGTSVGASSVVSLEIDNYAPYWTSKLSTPPPKPRELNIDERIPLYLHNLGIDQSPSTILTPFAPRGPIREPEFSPTDLLTIKGSTGTPTKSAQPSEGSSPHKGEYSRSSILSVDSSISIPFSLDSLGPAVSVPEQVRKTSSDTEANQSGRRLAASSEPEEDSHSSALQPSQQQQDGNLTRSQKINQPGDELDSDISLAVKSRSRERNLELKTSRSVEQNTEESFVSSKALSEIHKLLSHAENMLSTESSAASSASPTAPHLLSDEDIFLSLRKKTSRLQDSSVSSSFTAGDPRSRSSMLWARSSSDSMLTSEKLRQSSVGRESLTSSWQPDYPSTQALVTAPASVTYKTTQDSTVGSGAEASLVLSKSARRTEPEGCSAAPPDQVPPQPAVSKPPPALSTQQLTSTPTDTAEEEENTTPGSPVQSSPSSPVLEDAEQEVMSDGSSGSSLAVRVAKLLQSESPATMMSSTASVTDYEESKAREWIKLKISGQKCEPLELHQEDRLRIEEIKRELLLKNPIKSQASTDTDSSGASSFRAPDVSDSPPAAETFAALSEANKQPTQPLQGLSTNPPDSSMLLQNPPRPDLEAKVCEIAAREGVTLPIKNRRALTSITIATCRRSTSPSPSSSPAPPLSPSPEPLHLRELHTEAASSQLPSNLDAESPQAYEASSSLHDRNQSVSAPGNQKRQDTVGGQFEALSASLQSLDREDLTVKLDSTQSLRRDDGLSGADDETHQATGSSDVKSPARTSHISHVHLTLSPKATDHTSTTAVHPKAVPRKDFVPLRHSPSAAISPDEGVGLSSPPEWFDNREPVRQRAPERSDTSTLFRSVGPQGQMTSTQSFTARHRSEISTRSFTTKAPVPILLPYKPHGSEELFYVPQTEADVSSAGNSDTTMESSHSGSDDAVPPRFSSDVLGHRDPGLDRGVTIRHSEGIYSKRIKTAAVKMQEPARTDYSVAAGRSSPPSANQTPDASSQVSSAFNRVPLLSSQEALKRDQGTSPIQFLQYDQPEPSWDRFQTVDVERNYDKGSSQMVQTFVSQTRGEGNHQRRDSDLLQSQQSSSSLDQLWQKFCDQWTTEESRPTRDSEASLLERLERLSRLIHNTRAANVSQIQEEEDFHPELKLGRRREEVTSRRKERKEEVKRSSEITGGRKAEPHIQQRLQVEETSHPAEDNSRASVSSSSCLSQHLSPVDGNDSETLSTVSGSMSSVDTTRLIRVFGADRVQRLKTSSSLSKLYRTIDKQRDGREQRRGRNSERPHIITPTETTGSDESVAADSASSTSTYTVSSHRGPSRTLAAKKAVKLVNKGVQAGDLEIVSNGTRRHTRDVGTTFPSPGDTRAFSQMSSSPSSVGRGGGGGGGQGGQRSPSKSQSVQKQRKSKKSPSKLYPAGVSWFISADSLKSESRKENEPEEDSSSWRPSTAWFEPYGRVHPWREPLRQRQVHEHRNVQQNYAHYPEPDPDPRNKTGLARASLQEALEMRRPEFISRSNQRVKRLALQVQERKLQAVFSRERDELFDHPGRPMRLPKPAGTALLKRAVPRKEMIQRSKQIYENLPEVQMRREEEKRKAEYRSYRLNAQLYNKRITNRVLGRRSAWQ